VIPILIVVVLFLATTRVIHAIQDAPKPANAVEVIGIGHQFWWEFRYPALGIVTANELHIPVSDPANPTPTYLKLLSADTDHSFWVPQPGGKDGFDSESRQHNVDGPAPGGHFPGTVRAILRHTTREDAAAGDRGQPGRFSGVGERAKAAAETR